MKPDHLLSTADQLTLIRFYNEDSWGKLTNEQLDNVPVDDEPQQDLSNLRVLHVDFGSTEDTISAWRSAYMPSMAGLAHWNSYHRSDGVPTLRENTHQYTAGIHEVRLDLTAHNDASPIIDIWQRTAEQGQVLAHAEVLSAMGVHRYLLEPRGRKVLLPVLGGYTLRLRGRETPQTLQTDTDYRRWGLRYYSATANRSADPVPIVL
jgi:hypothetical protein